MTSPLLIIPKIESFVVRLEGDRILILRDGRKVLEFPAGEVAETIARAIVQQSKKAEELKNAERIALDQAVLLRAGFPIGLTSHPKIQEEAAKEAAWNSDLRRYMPGGVKSAEQFGTPAVRRTAPPKKGNDT